MPLSRAEAPRFLKLGVKRSESSVEISEVIVGVKPGKRAAFFHREPYMNTIQFGYVTVDWSNSATAIISYHQVNSDRPGHMLEVEHAIEEWVGKDANSDSPSEISKSRLFIRRWSTTETVDRDTPLLTIATKGTTGISLLKIKADSSS